MAVDAKQAVLLDTLRKLLRRGASGHLINMLQKLRPADIAPLLSSLPASERTSVFVQMGEKAPAIAAAIVSELHPVPAAELLQAMPPETIGRVLAELPYDEAADFMAALPPELQESVLGRMGRDDSAAVQRLLLYPPDTAGRIMTPDVFSLAEDLTEILLTRDPLSERVHHTRGEMAGLLLRSVGHFATARLRPKRTGIESASRP